MLPVVIFHYTENIIYLFEFWQLCSSIVISDIFYLFTVNFGHRLKDKTTEHDSLIKSLPQMLLINALLYLKQHVEASFWFVLSIACQQLLHDPTCDNMHILGNPS